MQMLQHFWVQHPPANIAERTGRVRLARHRLARGLELLREPCLYHLQTIIASK